jgi:hypothetical protein
MKRFISFIGIVALMVVVLGLGYYFRYQSGPAGVVPEGSSEYPIELPEVGTVPAGSLGGATGLPTGTKFGAVSEDEAAGYAALADMVLLVRMDGQVVKISGKAREVLSGGLLEDVVGAWFSKDAQMVIVGYGGLRAPKYSLFDIPSKSWRQLDGIEAPAWSPTDARLAYISKLGGSKRLMTLNMADPKAQPLLLTDLRIEDATIAWPSTQRILIGERAGARYEGSAWLFDVKTGLLKRIVEDRLGVEVLWSFAGNRGLEFRTGSNQRGGDLFILDDAGREVKQFEILTLPEKCAFAHYFVSSTPPEVVATSSATGTKAKAKTTPLPPPKLVESLWCAMPRDQAGLDLWTLPDEYDMGMFNTADDIYEINVDSGAITSPASSPAAFDATNLSRVGERIYFKNKIDGRIYFLQIEKQNPS